MGSKSNLLKYTLSLGVAAVLLYFSFRGVEWENFAAALGNCRWVWVAVAMIAGVMAFWVRALRWRQLVLPLDPDVPRKSVFNAINIGYLVNLALPRIGELVRCGVLARHTKSAGYDKVLGTVVLERIWDVLMMFVLVGVLAVTMWGRFGAFFVDKMLLPFSGRLDVGLGAVVLAAVLLGVLCIWLVYRFRDKWKPLMKIWGFCEGLWSGILSCMRMEKAWLFLLYSLIIWGLYWLMSASVLWAVQGMDTSSLPAEFSGAVQCLSSLAAEDALFLMLAGSLSSLVPVPGGFGTFHYIVALALSTVYGVPFEIGIVFATLSHESQTLTMLICGLASYAAETFVPKESGTPS